MRCYVHPLRILHIRKRSSYRVSLKRSAHLRNHRKKQSSISKYFDVSLDYLMKEENSISENAVSLEVHQTEATNKREKRILGIATCIIGVVLLIAWGIVSVFMPSASEQIGTSSMITIDGNGIFLLICLVAIIAGAVLLLKSTSNK